jgi:hypothetical protein
MCEMVRSKLLEVDDNLVRASMVTGGVAKGRPTKKQVPRLACATALPKPFRCACVSVAAAPHGHHGAERPAARLCSSCCPWAAVHRSLSFAVRAGALSRWYAPLHDPAYAHLHARAQPDTNHSMSQRRRRFAPTLARAPHCASVALGADSHGAAFAASVRSGSSTASLPNMRRRRRLPR